MQTIATTFILQTHISSTFAFHIIRLRDCVEQYQRRWQYQHDMKPLLHIRKAL